MHTEVCNRCNRNKSEVKLSVDPGPPMAPRPPLRGPPPSSSGLFSTHPMGLGMDILALRQAMHMHAALAASRG